MAETELPGFELEIFSFDVGIQPGNRRSDHAWVWRVICVNVPAISLIRIRNLGGGCAYYTKLAVYTYPEVHEDLELVAVAGPKKLKYCYHLTTRSLVKDLWGLSLSINGELHPESSGFSQKLYCYVFIEPMPFPELSVLSKELNFFLVVTR